MNPRDQQNLEFLLNASLATITSWFNEMTADDHLYAIELLALAKVELDNQASLLNYAEMAELEDLTAANAVLARFRLH